MAVPRIYAAGAALRSIRDRCSPRHPQYSVYGTGQVRLCVPAGGYRYLVIADVIPPAARGGFRMRSAGVSGLCADPNKAAERLTLGFQEVSRCVSAPAGHEYHACDSSMGQRTAFVRESWQLIKQAPLLGNGAGSFWYSNQKTGYSVHNPHNEYLLATVQTGLAGLVLFLGWMACYFRAARYQTPACRALFIALLGSYLACHLFNSFLLDSSEGHLFVILSGILAGGVVKHHLPLTDGTD